MKLSRLVLTLTILNLISIRFINALKCKVHDGPSESEMKRVARSCVKRFSEDQANNNSESDDERDIDDRGGYNQKDNIRNQNRDNTQSRSRYHQFRKRSTWDRNRQNQNERRYENSRNSSNSQQQHQQGGGTNNRNNNNNNGAVQDRENQNDRSCVIHCFFDELNLLNKHDFPDKHKVIYVITRDIRDNELREFYTDAIQECFRFLEMEQRMDKCQFSKNLINCMAEYARANCEDWYNHTMIFS